MKGSSVFFLGLQLRMQIQHNQRNIYDTTFFQVVLLSTVLCLQYAFFNVNYILLGFKL